MVLSNEILFNRLTAAANASAASAGHSRLGRTVRLRVLRLFCDDGFHTVLVYQSTAQVARIGDEQTGREI
jgi:hypothetical protein